MLVNSPTQRHDDPRNGACCPLCGGHAAVHLVTGYDRLYLRPAEYPYLRCAGCGLVRQQSPPGAHQMTELYPADYHARIQPIERNLDKAVNRIAIRYFYGVNRVSRSRAIRAVFRLLSGRILRGLREPHGGNRVLDVGCGGGSELSVYQRLGWTARGIDVDPSACARCRSRGLVVHQGTVFDAPFAPEFDLVLMNHIIEHVSDPVALLRRAAGFLAPGGIIVLRTPNVASLGFALYRSCWFGLDAPRHLMLFDPRSLRRLAARAGVVVRALRTRADPSILAASHLYRQRQGPVLPSDPVRWRALVTQTTAARPSRLYREVVTPLARAAAACGRGDEIETELTVPCP